MSSLPFGYCAPLNRYSYPAYQGVCLIYRSPSAGHSTVCISHRHDIHFTWLYMVEALRLPAPAIQEAGTCVRSGMQIASRLSLRKVQRLNSWVRVADRDRASFHKSSWDTQPLSGCGIERIQLKVPLVQFTISVIETRSQSDGWDTVRSNIKQRQWSGGFEVAIHRIHELGAGPRVFLQLDPNTTPSAKALVVQRVYGASKYKCTMPCKTDSPRALNLAKQWIQSCSKLRSVCRHLQAQTDRPFLPKLASKLLWILLWISQGVTISPAHLCYPW